jgi:hypothetical protein
MTVKDLFSKTEQSLRGCLKGNRAYKEIKNDHCPNLADAIKKLEWEYHPIFLNKTGLTPHEFWSGLHQLTRNFHVNPYEVTRAEAITKIKRLLGKYGETPKAEIRNNKRLLL